MPTLARFLSIILHPLLMPTLVFWLALQMDPHLAYFMGDEQRWITVGMVALMTIGFPITSVLLLLRTGMLTDLTMPTRQERIAPYAMTLAYYGMAWYLLGRSPLHPAAVALATGAFLSLFATLVITFRWKISAHMVGIGGALGAMIGLQLAHGVSLFVPIAALIVIAGALGTARLIDGDHTPAQIYAGVLVGAACTVATIVVAG